MKKLIYLQSNKYYKPIKELGWGVECYNKTYKRNVVIIIENNLEKIVKKVKDGWQIIPGNENWLLRSPEVSLYDLSEIHLNPTLNPVEILAYYKFLNKQNIINLLKKIIRENNLANLKVINLESNLYFESCLRIAGSDKRINLLPKLLFNYFIKTKDGQREIENAKKIIINRKLAIGSKKYNQCDKEVKNLFNKISNEYKNIGRMLNIPGRRIYTGIWKNLDEYDAVFFVPTGGFPFLCGYAQEVKNFNKINLIEYHSTMHNNKEIFRLNNWKNTYKKIALVDIAYSGKTIRTINQKIKNIVKNQDIKIDNIGLFPKSRKSLSKIDYAIIIDKMIKIDPKMAQDQNFFEDTFIKIANTKYEANC